LQRNGACGNTVVDDVLPEIKRRPEAAPKGKDLVVDEFKKVLTSYLGTIVYQD
jgi:hypothetical protein